MKELLKRLSNIGGRSAATSVDQQMSLAAFGKHPAWDDHIPGIGMDTEALAHLKQLFYVTGIGGQIDSGAWEKLDFTKRLEGFDHSFLWLRAGHVMLGQLWSSSDRKGRSKYPMILCVDGEHVSPGFVLANGWLELERLRDQCKALTSAEQVTAECHVSLERLRLVLAHQEKWRPELSLKLEARRQFLESPEFGPDRIGLLRVLHEIRYFVTGKGTKTRPSRDASAKHTQQLRVPMPASLQAEGLLPWIEFLRCVIPAEISMLLIKRTDVNWLDVILGEPTGDEFFCLQASLDALPLATAIPYEILPELRLGLQELERRFSNLQSSPVIPVMSVARQSEAQTTPVLKGRVKRDDSSKNGKSQWVIYGIIGAVILIGIVGWALLGERKGQTSSIAAIVKQVTNGPSTSSSDAGQVAAQGKKYQTAIQSAKDALAKMDYNSAEQQAEAALVAKPGDAVAAKLKMDVESQKVMAEDAKKKKRQYDDAMQLANSAYGQQNYDEAIRQAELALTTKPGDAGAQALKGNAETQKSQLLAEQQRKQQYDKAMQAAKLAYDKNNYDEAIGQTTVALANKPGDVAAMKLKADAESQMVVAAVKIEQEKNYQTAMQAAHAAFDQKKDYAGALTQVNVALEIKPSDAAATELKAEAESQINVRKNERQYQSAIQSAQSAWNKKDFDAVTQQANVALKIKPGEKTAADLKAWGMTMQEAQSNFTNGNYEKAIALCKSYPDVEAFSTLTSQIKTKENEERDSLYAQLELYSVWFGVMKPKDAKYPEARKALPLDAGEIPLNEKTKNQNLVDKLAQKLETGGWLDENRKKIVKAIKTNINEN